jgi:hypothetical protein
VRHDRRAQAAQFLPALLGIGLAQCQLALLLQGKYALDFRIQAPRGQFVDRVNSASSMVAFRVRTIN